MIRVLTAILLFAPVWVFAQEAAQPTTEAPTSGGVFIPNTGPASPTPTSAAPPSGGAHAVPGVTAAPTISLPGSSGAKAPEPAQATGSNVKTTGSFRSRLEHGNQLLRGGDADGALAQYRDLQTDDPESALLYYNIGCAEYKRGMQETELKAARDATQSFQQAKAAFEKVRVAPDPALRKEAGFNYANSLTREAEQAGGAQQYEQSVKAFKDAVAAYEQFLKDYPDHAGAKKNLDYVRYRLKSMMQNPPPPQQDQQGDKKEEQQKQDSDQQKDQQNQSGEQDKQDQEKKEGQDKQDQQKSEQEQKEQQEKQDEEKKEGQDQQDQAQQEQAKQEQGKQEQAKDAGKDERQNVESILQSLEDTDKREQKEVRNQRTDIRMGKDWW